MRKLYDHRAEAAVLESAMINNASIEDGNIILGVTSAYFHNQIYGAIWEAINKLRNHGKPIDFTTLRDALIGKVSESSLIEAISGDHCKTSRNMEYYAKIVKNYSARRALIELSQSIQDSVNNIQTPLAEVIDSAESGLFSVSSQQEVSDFVSVGSIVDEVADKILESASKPDHLTGVPTNIKRLDDALRGLQNSELIIIGARPSVGKTAFALNLAYNAAHYNNVPVLFCSLEMSASSVTSRLISISKGCNQGRLRSGFLLEQERRALSEGRLVLQKTPIWIDDTPNATLFTVRSKARRHAVKYGKGMVIIDYLQLMRLGEKIDRRAEVDMITKQMKGLARELDCPVVLLSQLNRGAEEATSVWELSAHFKESGSCEEDADVAIALTPLSKEMAKEYETQNGKGSSDNIISVTILKHRNGPRDSFGLIFDRPTQRFLSPERTAPRPEPRDVDGDKEYVENDDGLPF